MTDERLAEIENRLNKATSGTWEVKQGTYAVHSPLYQCWIPQDINDAEFLARSKQDIPDLISALRAERAKVDELQKELDSFTIPRPIEDIHEDYGDVLCWNLPVEYYPDVKSCLDLSFNEDDYTHFTLIPNIKDPADGK